MSNTLELKFGTIRAKEIIARHMLNKILVPMAKQLLNDAVNGRIAIGHNMTGNTVNSYAVGIYVKGKLVDIETMSGSIPSPLRKKLAQGAKFHAGRQRWDEEIQQHTFEATIATNGTTEAERSLAFLKSFKAIADSWTLVVCNGVEYATFQESAMNIDTLSTNFDFAKFVIPTMFTPIPD